MALLALLTLSSHLFHLPFPDEKKEKDYNRDATTYKLRNTGSHSQTFRRDKQIGRTDSRHKQSRQQGDKI